MTEQHVCQNNLNKDHKTMVEDERKKINNLCDMLIKTVGRIKALKDSGLKVSDLSVYIDKLHEYNELKDAAQMVLGHIAIMKGVCTRDIYPEYDLHLDD